MGKVINFARSLDKCKSTTRLLKRREENNQHTNLWMLFEEEKFFVEIIKQWPCFSTLEANIKPNELFTRYCDNLLSESQECVIDFMLHIHDPNFIFDINFSLKNWDKDDRCFFMYFLEKHAEVVSV